MELKRLQMQKREALANEGGELLKKVEGSLLQDEELRQLFGSASTSLSLSTKVKDLLDVGAPAKAAERIVDDLLSLVVAVSEMRQEVIHLYAKTANVQFRRNISTELKVEKKEAHRCQIQKRQATQGKKAALKKAKV